MNHHDNSPGSSRPASAVLRLGGHAPALLLGAPVACPPAQPGAASVILGWTTTGEPVELTVTSGAWLRDLFGAVAVAGAENFAATAAAS